MNTTKKKKMITLSVCKHCTGEYDKEDLKRSLGKESMPVILGYCSAHCYTLHQIQHI